MAKVRDDIKKTYDNWCYLQGARSTKRGVCQYNPFPDGQHWMYDYLFPEVLMLYDSFIGDAWVNRSKAEMYTSYEHFRKQTFTLYNKGARIFPCWIMSEDDVLRIMIETGVMKGGKGNG